VAISEWVMADLVREVCFDVGDGPLLLGGALAGYRTFADALGAGARFPYMIVGVDDPAAWEAGSGTLDGEGRLLREPMASSAGGDAVDFAPGEKRIGLVLHSGWIAAVEGHGHGLAAIDGLGEVLAGKQDGSAGLDALAGLATTGFGRALLEQGDGAAVRAHVGAGTVTAVAASGGTTGLEFDGGPVNGSGTLTLGGTLAIGHGGTGASSAGAARSALGLGTMATLASEAIGAALVPASDGAIDLGSAARRYANAHVVAASFGGGSANRTMKIDANSGYTTYVEFDTGGVRRWLFGRNSSNNFAITAYDSGNNLVGVACGFSNATLDASFAGHVVPATDNSRTCGAAAARWSVIYAASGTINTSDARAKCDVGAVPEALLDAWGDVQWRQFRFVDAVAAKGEDARWHVGLVAQAVRDAIDAQMGEGAAVRLGLLCHDAWPAEAEEWDGEGALIRPARAAGERWGLRYEECLALEAAWQRRRIDRIEAQVSGGGDAGG